MKWISKWLGGDKDVPLDQDARDARIGSERRLRDAHADTARVDDVARRARELRRTNNWAPRIRKALGAD